MPTRSDQARLPVRRRHLEAEPRVGGDRGVVVRPDVERDRLDPVLEQQQAESGAGSPRQPSPTKLRQRGDVAERRHAPGWRVDVHAGHAGEAAVLPDPDVAPGREHPRREPCLRDTRRGRARRAPGDRSSPSRSTGAALGSRRSVRASASLRCGSAASTAYRSAEDLEQRRRGVHVEGGRQRRQQLARAATPSPSARLLGDRDQDRDRRARV